MIEQTLENSTDSNIGGVNDTKEVNGDEGDGGKCTVVIPCNAFDEVADGDTDDVGSRSTDDA